MHFLEFSDHEKNSHYVFSDNRLGARNKAQLTHLLLDSFTAGNANLRSQRPLLLEVQSAAARSKTRTITKIRSKFTIFSIRAKIYTLDHKFSVPIIFINSKIKAIWIAKIDLMQKLFICVYFEQSVCIWNRACVLCENCVQSVYR